MFYEAYSLSVLAAGLAMLMFLVVRGKSIFVVAPLCALLTVTFSGADPVATMTGPYAAGFADYLRNFYLVFALGLLHAIMTGSDTEHWPTHLLYSATVGALLGAVFVRLIANRWIAENRKAPGYP